MTVVVLAVLLTGPTSARASSILIGTTDTGSPELMVGECCYIAQSFTLTSAIDVSEIRVAMSGFGSDLFTLWLTDNLGPTATAANLLFQEDATFPDTGGGISPGLVAFTANISLLPGTYYLVTSSAQTLVTQGWVAAATLLPSAVGTVGPVYTACCGPGPALDPTFAPASAFTQSAAFLDQLGFEIRGEELNPVPEPVSLLTLGAGLAALARLRRRV